MAPLAKGDKKGACRLCFDIVWRVRVDIGSNEKRIAGYLVSFALE